MKTVRQASGSYTPPPPPPSCFRLVTLPLASAHSPLPTPLRKSAFVTADAAGAALGSTGSRLWVPRVPRLIPLPDPCLNSCTPTFISCPALPPRAPPVSRPPLNRFGARGSATLRAGASPLPATAAAPAASSPRTQSCSLPTVAVAAPHCRSSPTHWCGGGGNDIPAGSPGMPAGMPAGMPPGWKAASAICAIALACALCAGST
mmetsp:Transcript_26833/g.79676  ORF Transcript_26833/g.79676 Transcript_26833/m.79676 type:complete len:204 (+) Transcript_26833:356-967(+)